MASENEREREGEPNIGVAVENLMAPIKLLSQPQRKGEPIKGVYYSIIPIIKFDVLLKWCEFILINILCHPPCFSI